jgi:hypothetical protein
MKKISDEYYYTGEIDQTLSGTATYRIESVVNPRENGALQKTAYFSKSIGNPTRTIHGDSLSK